MHIESQLNIQMFNEKPSMLLMRTLNLVPYQLSDEHCLFLCCTNMLSKPMCRYCNDLNKTRPKSKQSFKAFYLLGRSV